MQSRARQKQNFVAGIVIWPSTQLEEEPKLNRGKLIKIQERTCFACITIFSLDKSSGILSQQRTEQAHECIYQTTKREREIEKLLPNHG